MFKIQARLHRPSMKAGKKMFFLKEAKVQPMKAKELIGKVESLTTLTGTDLKAFNDALEHELINLLMHNHSVQLGDLGTFRCVVKNIPGSCSLDKKEITVANCVKGVKVVFTPSVALKRMLAPGQGIEFERIPGDENEVATGV